MTTTINTDHLLERLRERVAERDAADRYCANCEAMLTETDLSTGECTQCHAMLVDDESVDEHLFDD